MSENTHYFVVKTLDYFEAKKTLERAAIPCIIDPLENVKYLGRGKWSEIPPDARWVEILTEQGDKLSKLFDTVARVTYYPKEACGLEFFIQGEPVACYCYDSTYLDYLKSEGMTLQEAGRAPEKRFSDKDFAKLAKEFRVDEQELRKLAHYEKFTEFLNCFNIPWLEMVDIGVQHWWPEKPTLASEIQD